VFTLPVYPEISRKNRIMLYRRLRTSVIRTSVMGKAAIAMAAAPVGKGETHGKNQVDGSNLTKNSEGIIEDCLKSVCDWAMRS
jgi:hypothetical protein